MKDKALIVDDNQDILKLVSNYLIKNGVEVDTASDKLMALKKLKSGFYKYAFIDLHLDETGEQGFDLLDAIREKDARTLMIVLTADSSLSALLTARSKGAFDYLYKPNLKNVEVADCLKRCSEFLDRWKQIYLDMKKAS